ncbi:hypothetical protein FVB43_12635 [Erwinia rhapontici]|uniref:DDE-type integrase/transposase/recombinase n=1 Tax=Erwinia rhapontici TaxID=55212 RepID=UPI0014382586|nr:DDE-type integrase/transposase/recombinase [Erwinia rhapontici]NKG30887.1 hypothetical protein [Erwinia rhapontici]
MAQPRPVRCLSILKQEGEEVSCYKAARLMGEAGLISHQSGRHRYRVRDKASLITKNELARQFSVAKPDKVWGGDITFIKTAQGWSYLAVVLDVYASKGVDWALFTAADSRFAQHVLKMVWVSSGKPIKIVVL